MKRNILILFSSIWLLLSCTTEEYFGPIPEGVPNLEELQEQYRQELVAAPHGWYIDYRPNTENGSTGIWVKFKDNGTVETLSDYFEFTEIQTTPRFRVGGAVFPELIFESYSVWHKLYDQMEGNYQFRLARMDDGRFKISDALVGKEGKAFYLRPATEQDVTNLLARGVMNDKIIAFRNSSSAYFQNITLENLVGSWELDHYLRKITFTWPNDEGFPETQTYPYQMTPTGIKFFSPIKVNQQTIDSIDFGAFETDRIYVDYAGDAGPGEVTVAHTPAFPAPGAADYFMIASRPTQLFIMNVELTAFSPAFEPELQNMLAKRPGIVRMQLYNNDLRYSPTFRVAIYYVDPDDGNTYYANTFYSATKHGEDHVSYTFGSNNSTARNIAEAIEPLLDRIFNEDGFTVVPYTNTATNQVLRLVSRRDSRYYITANSTLLNYLYGQ